MVNNFFGHTGSPFDHRVERPFITQTVALEHATNCRTLPFLLAMPAQRPRHMFAHQSRPIVLSRAQGADDLG